MNNDIPVQAVSLIKTLKDFAKKQDVDLRFDWTPAELEEFDRIQELKIKEEVRKHCDEIAKKEHERMIMQALNRASVPAEYRNRGLDQITINSPYLQNTMQQVKGYLENFNLMKERGVGFLFFGSKGTGKTHIACAMVEELAKRGFHSAYVTLSEILQTIKKGYEGNKSELTSLEPFMNCDFLVIDELGAVRNTDFAETILFDLVNRRNSQLLPTVFITNLKVSELPDAVGFRTFDRIKQRTVFLPFMGDSYRKEIKNIFDVL